MIYSQFGATEDAAGNVVIDTAAIADRARDIIADGRAFPGGGVKALTAAIACGYCRLYGGEAVGFPATWAHEAATSLKGLIEAAHVAAENLPAAWATDRDTQKPLAAAVMFERMDAWAASSTLDAAVEAAGDAEIAEELEALAAVIYEFDAVLWDRVDVIATLAETQLLAGWRASLAPSVQLPWWLDGRLEMNLPPKRVYVIRSA